MALAPLISGVCRTAGTRPMISMPRKIIRITMYTICWLSLIQVINECICLYYFYPFVHDRAAMRDAATFYELVVEVQVQLSFCIDDELEEIQHVLTIQLAGVIGHGRW